MVLLVGLFVFTVLFASVRFLDPPFSVLGLLTTFSSLFLFVYGIYLGLYLNFGQAIFYRELSAESD